MNGCNIITRYNAALKKSFGQHEWNGEPYSECERCLSLVNSRKQVTFGFGATPSRLFFAGEAPGQQGCNITGVPFTRDKSGRLFQSCLWRAGLDFERVYTTNICKCSPPGNRMPDPKEIENCLPYLKNEIAATKPQLVVCLGRTAACAFLGEKEKFSVVMQAGEIMPSNVEWYKGNIMLLPHPAYILRCTDKKYKTFYFELFKDIAKWYEETSSTATKITDERWGGGGIDGFRHE